MGTHVARARSHPRRWAVPCRSPGPTWTPPRTFPPSTSSSPWRSVAQSLSLSALYCVEKLRAKPAGDGALADDAGFGGPPRATDTASPALYDDAGWVNPTERPSMRGRHCAGLTGCNTKNCPLRKTSQENRRNGNAFSDPSKPNFSRDMREKGRYDDNGRHFRRHHGGAEVGDGRISAARVSAGSRGEARFTFP